MIIKIINKKTVINDDDNQTDHHNRIAMFCRFGIRLPLAASAQCASRCLLVFSYRRGHNGDDHDVDHDDDDNGDGVLVMI